mgnify:CR=1 FL=1
MSALHHLSFCRLGCAWIEGKIVAEQNHVGGEGGVDVCVEVSIRRILLPLIETQGCEEHGIPTWTLVIESSQGRIRGKEAATRVWKGVLKIVGDVEVVANDLARAFLQHGKRKKVRAIVELASSLAIEPFPNIRNIEEVDPGRLERDTFETEREPGLGRIGCVGAGLYRRSNVVEHQRIRV